MNISPINADSQCEPLCRSYVCAVFAMLRIRTQNEAGPHLAQLLWAVGVLSDHSPHYLGAWHFSDLQHARWPVIADDLYNRGIERLRIVFVPDPVEVQAALAPRYRSLTVLPMPVSVDDPVIDSTLFGHRQYIERVLAVASPLSLRLKRAATRHGPFANAAAAAALLRRSADRYVEANWPASLAPPPRTPRATASRRLATESTGPTGQ
jgi:hypothetical protein